MRNAIARWTPTGDVVRDRFGSLIEQAFNDMLRPYGTDAEAVSSRTWIPRVDIREGADRRRLRIAVERVPQGIQPGTHAHRRRPGARLPRISTLRGGQARWRARQHEALGKA